MATDKEYYTISLKTSAGHEYHINVHDDEDLLDLLLCIKSNVAVRIQNKNNKELIPFSQTRLAQKLMIPWLVNKIRHKIIQ